MRRGFRAVGVAVSLTLATLTSACTTSTSPPIESSSTTAASSTTTAPTTPPSSTFSGSATTASGVPDAAKANTADGAVAFVNFFLGQANEAFNNLNESLVEQLSAQDCKTCAAMSNQIAKYKAANQRYMGEFAHPVIVAINRFEGSTVQVLVENNGAGGKVVDAAGRTVEEVPPDRGKVIVSLVRASSDWRILGIQGAS